VLAIVVGCSIGNEDFEEIHFSWWLEISKSIMFKSFSVPWWLDQWEDMIVVILCKFLYSNYLIQFFTGMNLYFPTKERGKKEYKWWIVIHNVLERHIIVLYFSSLLAFIYQIIGTFYWLVLEKYFWKWWTSLWRLSLILRWQQKCIKNTISQNYLFIKWNYLLFLHLIIVNM